MGASPAYKVYDDEGHYTAAFYDPLEAARYIQAFTYDGYNARWGHGKKQVFWTYQLEDMGLDDMDALIAERLAAMKKNFSFD